MTSGVGVWLDHKRAVIVAVSAQGETTRSIESRVEKHVRFSGGAHSQDPAGAGHASAEDTIDRRFAGHLSVYYDEVVAALRDYESILVFGPGEAKGELVARLAREGLRGRIVAVETNDKMTHRQIAAKVRERFPVSPAPAAVHPHGAAGS